MSLRLTAFIALVLLLGCATEPPPPDDCRCFFETSRVSVRCGTSCVGGDLLTCSASEISEAPGACDSGFVAAGQRDAGTPDAGPRDAGTRDASVEMPVDAGVDLPPDPPACQPKRDDCTCPVRLSSQVTLIVPCCASICFASLDGGGWRCSATGTSERISSCE